MKIRHEETPHGVRSYQKQGMRCGACDTPFKAETEVNVPIDRYVASMMAITCPTCGASAKNSNMLLGMGLSLPEDRALRIASGSLSDRVSDWHANGETGLSSEYVASYMTGEITNPAHPHDYDDLRRVILLLDRIPEWTSRMAELAEVPGWYGIATRWQEIVDAVITADPEALKPTSASHVLEGIYNLDKPKDAQ